MQQLLEIAPERRVVERAPAQRRAVELAAVGQERFAQCVDHGAVSRLAAAADRMRDVVGVEHVGAARRERRGHRRLAAADAAGEADQVGSRHA